MKPVGNIPHKSKSEVKPAVRNDVRGNSKQFFRFSQSASKYLFTDSYNSSAFFSIILANEGCFGSMAMVIGYALSMLFLIITFPITICFSVKVKQGPISNKPNKLTFSSLLGRSRI